MFSVCGTPWVKHHKHVNRDSTIIQSPVTARLYKAWWPWSFKHKMVLWVTLAVADLCTKFEHSKPFCSRVKSLDVTNRQTAIFWPYNVHFYQVWSLWPFILKLRHISVSLSQSEDVVCVSTYLSFMCTSEHMWPCDTNVWPTDLKTISQNGHGTGNASVKFGLATSFRPQVMCRNRTDR